MSNTDNRTKLAERERKELERISLGLRIDRLGSDMAPCSVYIRIYCHYIIDSRKSSRYSEYIRHRRPRYDYTSRLPSLNDWESIDRQY